MYMGRSTFQVTAIHAVGEDFAEPELHWQPEGLAGGRTEPSTLEVSTGMVSYISQSFNSAGL